MKKISSFVSNILYGTVSDPICWSNRRLLFRQNRDHHCRKPCLGRRCRGVVCPFSLLFYQMLITDPSPDDHKKLVDVKETSRETTLCLAAAHALVKLDDGTVVGDPMEKTTLDAMAWSIGKGTYLDYHMRLANTSQGIPLVHPKMPVLTEFKSRSDGVSSFHQHSSVCRPFQRHQRAKPWLPLRVHRKRSRIC